MTAAPMLFRWNGDAMLLHRRHRADADAQFVIGQSYRLAEVEERSEASHKQEFAWLREAWLSLPEGIAKDYPSTEFLRKRALIATGWCTVSDYPCSSRAEADRWARHLRNEADEYAVILVEQTVVRVLKAKSQSMRAMGKADFEASKRDILEWVANLLDVAPATLAKQREAA